MAITKILNIKESEGRNPASHLKNALEYIQNPNKTEECVLVGGINCLPDTAFEQMEETKNIFHKTGKRQGYHVIISFSPEEKVTAEQAMYVLEHFAKDVLGDDYEAVYAVHTDREHMHGHLIWNSVSMTIGKKYNSPKGNWRNHLQPITNKYCDELGLSIMPAEYSRNPKNISRDKWEKEMSMKEIILRDAKMCAYAAGNVEHFKYLMKRLGYVFKKDAWMEVQEELDELKLGKRDLKRQIQLADGIIKEDLYTAYYVVSGKEEIVADRDVEIPGMEEDTAVEKATATVVEPDRNVEVMNPNNNQNEISRLKGQADSARKQQTDLDGIGIPEIHNSSDMNVAGVGESITDVTDKGEYVETKENEPVDKVGWIVRRISELGGYENVSDSVKADIFGFDIADVGSSIRLFSDVMKRLGIKLDGDELYEEFHRIYDESVDRDTGKEKAEDKMWNRGRGR